jgi:hypothetical protein
MEPRLKTSIQWTPFPVEFIQQIVEASEDHFSDYEKNGRHFIADGRIYPNEILLRIGLSAPKGSLRQDNFEASLEYSVEKEKPIEQIHLLVDFLAETWATFLEDDPQREDLPLLWAPQMFEKREIYLRYSSENTELETQANSLLNLDEKKLVYEEEEETVP